MSVQGQLFTDMLDEATVFVVTSLDPAASVEPSQGNHCNFLPPCLSFWVIFMMFLQFTTLVETWLIGKNMAMGILPHSTSLSACLPGWKPQSCLRDGETCRCVGGSRTRRRPATSSKHCSVSAEEMYTWMCDMWFLKSHTWLFYPSVCTLHMSLHLVI